ncbi:MAG: zinc ribbon domain-containing protein [Prevotella sp.]|nr:zinc ribbon domain-containing protein [Prevotella sp.]
MKCPKCSHENAEGAKYCSQCGQNLADVKDWPSLLLLGWCGSLIFFAAAYFVIGYVGSLLNMEWQARNYAIFVISIIQSFTFLVIPFAIRKTSYKVAAFIMVLIYIVWTVVSNVSSIINTYEISSNY